MHVRVRAAVVVLASAVLSLSWWHAPAFAHESDPRLVFTLDAISPPPPPGIVIRVRPGIAEEVIAQNPTTKPLTVIGNLNRPFLRISATGVQADLGSPDWYLTNSPTGSALVPSSAGPRAPAHWVTVSRSNSWGWFDHRLHPQTLDLPSTIRRTTRVAEWQIPVDYEGRRSIVSGHTDVLPLVGAFTVTADPAPTGLVVSALPGRLPGLFLSDPSGLPAVVFGSDGQPFFRLDQHGVEVDEGSPSWVEDQRARGNLVPTVTSRPQWRRISATPSISWLDPRLRYPRDIPRDPTVAADIQRWAVQLTLQGRRAALTGLIRWTPAAAPPGDENSGKARAFTVAGIALLGMASGLAVSAARRVRSRSRGGVASKSS